MSKTIYYLGAGASYGKRNKDEIEEGLPIVSEIPVEIGKFKAFIANAEIPDGYINFHDLFQISPADVESAKQFMVSDIDGLIAGIKEHATIDTYARKLYLTQNFHTFNKLKEVLCAFFVWEQLEHKPDNRYDTFLANVLEAGTLELPSEISIISWNYDSQIEMAYKAYRYASSLPVFEKNIEGEWSVLPKYGKVFKVNGSATFANKSIVTSIKEDKNASAAVQLILYYSQSHVDTSEFGFQFKTHLSFAWEDTVNNDKMMKSIIDTTADTEQVVVIGYSFPYFNRETDRAIFQGMTNLKKIYIQDINPSAVEQSIRAVLPSNKPITIVPISSCTQFYLPIEL